MKKWTLCVILLLTLPAFATIANVQSNAKWTCTGSGSSITCSVILTTQPTTTGNLLAVWTFWESTSTYTAAVTDSIVSPQPNTFYSAVGPTLQSVSNTSAQIFYAKNITGSTPPNKDTVTVTFTCVSSCGSPSISAGGIVAVEYSGLDTMYPLDSVSAGYSTSGNPTGLLDSGTVAPANANLLVFGGGTSDTTYTVSVGSGFTSIQSNPGSITEQLITTSPNNTLQRATACLGTPLPCPATGDWVMQMAVFRDASWTVGGGWTPVRVGQIVDASQFTGTGNRDIGDRVTQAYNSGCPATGCSGILPPLSGSFSTPIVATTLGKPFFFQMAPQTSRLTYTPTSGSAITFGWGANNSPLNFLPGAGISGLHLFGSGGTSSVGVQMSDGVNGAQHSLIDNSFINDFGVNVADEITVSAPCERVDLEALKATKARRKGAER